MNIWLQFISVLYMCYYQGIIVVSWVYLRTVW